MSKSNNTPFFSIVIPTIGRVDGLTTALKSVICQKFTDFEIIIVNNSQLVDYEVKIENVVNSFKDKRITVFTTHLEERSNARNKGVELSKGKYICFLDDDDELLEDHLDVFYNRIVSEKFPVAILRTGMLYFNTQGKTIKKSEHCPSSEDPIVFFLDHMVGIHTLCFHSDVLNKISFHSSFYYFEDTHLLIRALFEYSFIQIENHSCIYNLSMQESTIEQLLLQLENNIGCIKDLFENYDMQLGRYIQVKRWKKYMLQKKYLDYAFLIIHKNKKVSIRIFLTSLKNGVSKKLLGRYSRFLKNLLLTKQD